MPKGKSSRVFQGIQARLVFIEKEDERAVLDLLRRFSSATPYAYNRLLEGKDRKELKSKDSPLCKLFGVSLRQERAPADTSAPSNTTSPTAPC